jgi:S-adenosyl methyltransferase
MSTPTTPENSGLFGAHRSIPDVASAARIYDYLLGGTHNYACDRVAAGHALRAVPWTGIAARMNREFLQRAVRHLIAAGVHQFVDLGSGIPTAGNVHEIAQSLVPDARVLYVDYERVAVEDGLQILRDNPHATSLWADIRQPDTILDSPEARSVLDFTKPIGLLVVSMLHFVPTQDDPWQAVERYKDRLASGSYLVLSHASPDSFTDHMRDQLRQAVGSYNDRVAESLYFRTGDEIDRFAQGWDIQEPGRVLVPDWRPDEDYIAEDGDDEPRRVMFALMARKP